jgi:hypothetical protein
MEQMFDFELRQQAEKYLAEYQAYIAGSEGGSFTISAALNLIQMSVPENVDSLLTKFAGEKTEYETHTVTKSKKNENKKIYKPWTWFQPKYIEYEEEETTSYTIKVIKMGKLFENSIQPYSNEFRQTIAKAKDVAVNNAKGLKEFFEREMGKLDNIVKESIARQQECLESEETLKQNIKENESKAAWLDGFIKELNSVLDI